MYFFLKFFMVVDLWKVVSKIQLIALRVFGPSFLVHSLIFFLPPGTLVYVLTTLTII